MAKLIRQLLEDGVLNKHQMPGHFPDSIQYLTVMGSNAYGVSDDDSDEDIYGFCIPEKSMIFPHLAGEIPGFGTQVQKFEQWQMHHVVDEKSGKEYDFSVYSIVKFFQLCMENNPNMVDSLFTPQNALRHCSPIAQMVREKRRLFLHKGSWHKFKGYAYSQKAKMRSKDDPKSEKRKQSREKFGFDVKFAYHLVRLLLEVEQILTTGDLVLNRDAELLKAIRRGEWTLEKIDEFFEEKERALEAVYLANDTLPHRPPEAEIKKLLLECLEHHYGSLKEAVAIEGVSESALRQIAEVVRSVGY